MTRMVSLRCALTCVVVAGLTPRTVHAQSPAPAASATPAPPAIAAVSHPDAPPPTLDARLNEILGQPGGLTSDQAAREAVASSPDVRAREAEVRAASATVDQAMIAFVPRVALSASFAQLSPIDPPTLGTITVADPTAHIAAGQPIPPGTTLYNYGLSFAIPSQQTFVQESLRIPLSDYLFRLVQSYTAATHSHRASILTERVARLRAAYDARVAYYNWVRAKLQVLVVEQALAQAREHMADARHAFDAGAASQADVMRVVSQVASAELLLARAEGLAIATLDQLRTMMHAPPQASATIGEDVRTELPASPVASDFDAQLADAYRHRLELQALAETLGALHWQAAATRAAGYPHLDAFGDVLTANPNPRYFPPTAVFNTTWQVGVSLSWSPNDLPSAIAGSRTVEAREQQIAAQRDQVRDMLRAELLQAVLLDREATIASRTTGDGLAAAEESYRVRRALFRNGRATSAELTDAESDVTRARLESLNARIDRRIARARLQHAVGGDVALAR